MKLLITGGRVLNPAERLDEVMDVLVEDGVIKRKGRHLDHDADHVIDACGCYVMPGLIDLHVHFRDPGYQYKEDIETGSAAAARGGFTTVCCMANTKPVNDCPEVTEYIVEKGRKTGLTNVLPIGAVTKNMDGREVSDMEGMKAAGIVAVSEDGKTVMNSEVYREAMIRAKDLGLPVMAHCEDMNLTNGGVMNECHKSDQLGFPGISNAVEDIIISRDIMLAKETGARLHLCHCSTKDGVYMIEQAKLEGIDVSGEACPHHFALCTEDIPGDDGNYKMNPPLRQREDMRAIIQGISDNVIDVISTDHAPHSDEEKSKGFNSPFGIVGLETSVPVTITKLVMTGYITPLKMAEKMSYNPAGIIGIDRGTLNDGAVADITIIDPDEAVTVDPGEFESKGNNTPFAGMRLFGAVKYTILGGRVVYDSAAGVIRK